MGSAARPQAGRAAADRLGQRARACALPARLQPSRPLPHRRARPALSAGAATAVRVLGTRGVADRRRSPSAAAMAHGPGGARGLGQHAARPRRAARAGPERPRSGPRTGADRRLGARGEAPAPKRAVVGLVGLQASDRVAVLHRAGDGGQAAALRAALRPTGAGHPEGGARRPDARSRRGTARAPANRLTGARGRRRARSARLLPARGRDGEGAGRGAGRGRRPDSGRGGGLGPHAGIPRRRRSDPPAGRGDRPGRAVRLGPLGAQPPAADLGLRLPPGDLRPGAEAASTATTCCRFCSATGSSPGWT